MPLSLYTDVFHSIQLNHLNLILVEDAVSVDAIENERPANRGAAEPLRAVGGHTSPQGLTVSRWLWKEYAGCTDCVEQLF